MIRCIYIIVALLMSQNLYGQINLVPNPSFEDTVACPNGPDQSEFSSFWHSSRNSPDYFNSCDSLSGIQGVPDNLIGYQYPFDGNAYMGLITYSRNSINYREHFGCTLNAPLIPGIQYKFTYYISQADNYNTLASNKIGIFLSSQFFDKNGINTPIANYSIAYTDSIISDTLNWIQIDKYFVADSAYSYFYLGNFFDDNNTDTSYYPPASHCYYFIDNLSLIIDSTTNVNNIHPSTKIINFYPNPVINYLNIDFRENCLIQIEVFNNLGIQVYEQIVNHHFKTKLNCQSLKCGLYFIKISNFKSIYYHKFIKS